MPISIAVEINSYVDFVFITAHPPNKGEQSENHESLRKSLNTFTGLKKNRLWVLIIYMITEALLW